MNSRVAEEAGIDGEFKLENFTYSTPSILEVLDGHLRNTNFSGITVSKMLARVAVKPGARVNEAVDLIRLCCLPNVIQMIPSTIKAMVRADLVYTVCGNKLCI